MRIPDETIEEVRRASDIVDVIGGYVQLKKRGKNYIARCPFHQEKTPSFTVSAEKQMYHCFGCGAGGNVFTFVMAQEKVSFVEAVRTLAERAGIVIPESTADRAQATENEGLYDACKTAGLHYYDNLVNSIEGKLALEYLHHRRFSDATIRKFGLGYAKNTWDDLVRHIEERKLDITQFITAGLVLKREEGQSYYDRFRGRAMFPIFSSSGRPIGFGARKLREDDPLGKYINSPETPIYNKSRNLYGLFQAKEAIRAKGFAILVEGYADLISLFQAGVENVVASSGTALTEDQIHLIGRYANAVTLVYDADSAGSKATMRGVDLLIEQGMDVKVAPLPQGEDPDSFVRTRGGEAFGRLIEGAVSFLDFKAAAFRDQGLLATPEGKTRAVRSLVETLAKMGDEIKRNFYIQYVAEKYGIYETVLYRELERILAREARRESFGGTREAPQTPAETLPASPDDAAAPLSAHERDLLKVMLEAGPAMVQFVFTHLTRDHFVHPLARKAVDVVMQSVESGKEWDLPSMVNGIDDAELGKFIADITVTRYDLSKEWSGVRQGDLWTIAEKSILRARAIEIRRLIEENLRRMKDATRSGEDLTPYMEESIRLERERKELETVRLINDSPAPEGQQ
ncbi:MAG: DNA primase [Bacteroidota bacterium]